MNCNEVLNLIGSAIDGVLARGLKKEFFEHVSLCAGCRKVYELELVAKSAVRLALKPVSAPTSVRVSVVESLQREYASDPSDPTFVERFLRAIPKPALVAGIAAIVIAYLLIPRNPSPEEMALHTASNDIINQTVKNFQRIRDGQMKPAIKACQPEGIIGYLEKNQIHFIAFIMPLEDCEWYGALVDEYQGVKIAHVMYKIGDDLMYMYQVRIEEATEGSALIIPPAARISLAKTGWYTDPQHPGCNIVLWKTNGTLCAAVSTMKKEKLMSLLTSR